MDFHTKLQNDLVNAMKARDDTQKWVVRLLKSTIELAEVSKGKALTDDEFLGVVQKEIKTRNESLADAQKAHRQDLVDAALAEIEILKTYLPAQLNPNELLELVRQTIVDVNATSSKDMGAVMKVLLPKLQGMATNSEASRVVKEELSKA
ncbi:MAG: GatB/YqeY domain-containing protein [Chloroflexi bacterium]|nr:GatB/YqeY domain-containing protein [Chloroflexota bacterium]